METLEPQRRQDWPKFLTLLVALGVMAAVLGALLWVVLHNLPAWTQNPTPEAKAHRGGMVRFAIICVAMLGLTLVVMFWLVVRFIGSRFQTTPEPSRTQHVDAWTLAGQRIQPPKEPEDEQGPPGEDDGPPK